LEHKECACCKSQGTGNGYQAALRTFERKKDNLIPALHAVQSKLGYLPDEAMLEIAEWLNIPVSEVHGTATFYTMFATEPKGQYIVRLCDSPPCHIEGSSGIKSIIEKELGVKAGQTTQDGRFTFEIVSCMGLCGVAPAVMVNDDVYGNLTPQSTVDILNKYRKES
jgi:NADH-quinone oxidoreductase subunit E